MRRKWIILCLAILAGCRSEKQQVPELRPKEPPLPMSAFSPEQPLAPSLSVSPTATRRPPPPGPVPLEGQWHMADYLSGPKRWKGPVFWRFNEDGTFVTWIEGPLDKDLDSLISIPIPPGETHLTGHWRATTTELQLSNVTTEAGKAIEPFVLDLGWVDGKLHIDIGGFRYSRD